MRLLTHKSQTFTPIGGVALRPQGGLSDAVGSTDGQGGKKMAYVLEEYTPQGDGQVCLWASKPSLMEIEAVVNNRLELLGVHQTIGFIKAVKIGDIGYSLIKG